MKAVAVYYNRKGIQWTMRRRRNEEEKRRRKALGICSRRYARQAVVSALFLNIIDMPVIEVYNNMPTYNRRGRSPK